MDLILETLDSYLFDKAYATVLPKDGDSLLTNAVRALPSWSSVSSNMHTPQIIVHGLNSTYSTQYVTPVWQFFFKFNPDEVYGVPGMPTSLGLPPTEYTYASLLNRDSTLRLFISLFFVVWTFGYILYFVTAGLQYLFVYDPINFSHPRYLKNQVRLELKQSFSAIPIMSAFTVPWFFAELKGYSKLYMNVEEYGWTYFWLQFPLFLMYTDFHIYLIHRWLHHPLIYKHLHKPHHKWIVPTPFASHAFHPMDGYLQSLPYHMFVFVFPLHKLAYMGLFTIVNVWSVMIHDGKFLSRNPVVNGSACHTVHHLYFNYNYGQYTTLWDRIGGSYRVPDQELYDNNMNQAKKYLKKQIEEMETIMGEVEGSDDRQYVDVETSRKSR